MVFENFPRLDEMFDDRVQYFPSRGYLDNVSGGNGYSRLNIAEDDSGETYLLAFHLGSIPALRDARHGTWSRFIDLADHPSKAARTTRYLTHGVFEIFNLPFTVLPVLDHRNIPTGPVMMGGA